MSPDSDRENPEKIGTSEHEPSGARSRISSKTEIDPNLKRLIDFWPILPAPIRAAVTALIESATPNASKSPQNAMK